jgi:hypothetical protein
LVLDADDYIGSVGTGLAYPQASAPFTFDGKYGLSFTQSTAAGENDVTGQVIVVGTSKSIAGAVDTNLGFSPQPNTPITGSFGTIPNSGRFSGKLTNTFFPSFGSTPHTIAIRFYLIDSNHGLFIETDSLTSAELSFGYFETSTPVCASCP